ncbi:hypothetical protein P3S67_022123 [Capsicum chacoense]
MTNLRRRFLNSRNHKLDFHYQLSNCLMLNMGYSKFSFLLIFCFCLLSFSSSIPHPCRKDQSISLLKFKISFTVNSSASVNCPNYDQKPSPKTNSWNMSRDCCSWDGVTCDEMTGHVIELDLSCSQHVGKIDSNSSLFQLSHLQRIDLSCNSFSNSEISPEFEMLKFKHHYFELLLQNLTQLRELHLTSVNISSTIPPNFSTHLTTLWLEETGLYGVIPENIFHLPNLETLVLFNNPQLSGYFLKTKWNSNASLTHLDLSGVNLLPKSLGYLNSLRSLSLQNCNLRGPIPESLSNLTHLESLYLNSNSLYGTIPSGIFSLPSLINLLLRNNYFSGQFEDFKSNSLLFIDLSYNQLLGHLPKSVQNLVNLYHLDLSSNDFSGHVDVSFFRDLKHLEILSLSYNRISLTNEYKHLEELDIPNNKIQGGIPNWYARRYSAMFGDITALEVLDMRHNNLSGNLPTTFSNGSSLRSLNLQDNKLEGKIPRSLTNCKELQVLDLRDNQLLDTFPMWLGTLPKLQVLILRSNKLHGPIQPSRIETSFPELRRIDLSYNGFSGNLPMSIMGDLIALRILNLSHNGLQGPILPSLVNLFVVESLDLSGNHLVGEIPAQFASLTALEVLNLSYNHLEGCIPQGNQFHTFENKSYEGNDGLRGFPLSKGCGNDGHDSASEKTYAGSLLDEESNSEFLNDFWKAALMGYGTGLCIGLSIIYILISIENMKWLERTVEELEHKIMMARRKKQRRQRNYRRSNNRY